MAMPYERIVQNAYVVNDIEAAARRWSAALNIGPFVLLEGIEMAMIHRGTEGRIALSAALAHAGAQDGDVVEALLARRIDVAIGGRPVAQLLDQLDLDVRDFEGAVARHEALGHPMAMLFGQPDGLTAYMDARADTGGMIELYSDYAGIKDLYDLVAARAAEWDGRAVIARP
jgi:Holliday junction resolvasome RuvABC ATP-dependent DNA helicase subunit